VFQEKISTRVHRRPEMEAALALANNIKEAAPDQAVILTVHEMKRLARNAAELMQLSSDLEKADILRAFMRVFQLSSRLQQLMKHDRCRWPGGGRGVS
jgi:DNA invertase Pin-like site-specific DNA recombinase